MFPSINPEEVGTTGLLWLFFSYGYVMYWASNLISEGSDLLMLVPSFAGLVGGVVLPILGAVPDGAIMLFSGLGSIDKAQETLSVGIGSLAGSTIMLMTIPFSLSIFTGRVDLDPSTGMPNYFKKPKLTPGLGVDSTLFHTGISVTKDVHIGGYVVAVTSIPFFMIQVPGMFIRGPLEEVTPEIAATQKYWALAGMLVCIAFFVGYLYYQVLSSNEGAARMKRVEATKQQLLKGKVSLSGAFFDTVKMASSRQLNTGSTRGYESIQQEVEDSKAMPPQVREYLKEVLLEPFHIYDSNHNGNLDKKEFKYFLRDFHETIKDEDVDEIYKQFDTDENGIITFDEFIDACYTIMLQHTCAADADNKHCSGANDVETGALQDNKPLVDGMFGPEEGDEENGEEEEIPPDISELSPEQQQTALKKRALVMLTIGTGLAVLFSDPLVDVLNEIANRIGVSPFYVAFVLAPIGSNASEIIASRYYAAKKTRRSITVSLTALTGAGTMSNTFCLSIFMGLIYFRGLAWSYTSETIAILLVEYALACMVQREKLTCFDALLILMFYPLSLVFVATLEHFGID
ncbi:Calcium-binding EF hand family protein [Seminavis robusta]|uniref:Calcium-binding EF hand family protein n=1 Tax=Seminavis robusta TaxID=568900 RepID=A0A9N8DNY6_9STRA|nr:Calcium-binding EF hand family protein [Seminavis robusta]|eukprot:Sro185_g080230.1 Calcium-binding EF hand family protein (573) ;mRNA; f:15754-17564